MYLKYIGIVILYIMFRITHIFWYPIAVVFRNRARNVVYNYFIDHHVWIEYFSFNNIETLDDRYLIKYNDIVTGYVMKNKVSKIKYYFYLITVWIWLDDNLNNDLYDIKDIVYLKDRYIILNKRILSIIQDTKSLKTTFELGDKRTEFIHSEFIPTLYHYSKMNKFNFQYIWMVSKKPLFLRNVFNTSIGWKLIVKNDKSYYILVP